MQSAQISPTIPYHQNSFPIRSVSQYELHNNKKSQVLNQKFNIQSPQNSRLRVHSFQENSNPNRTLQTILKKRQQKILKIRQQNYQRTDHMNKIGFKQSNGIMNQPPDYIKNKYTFKNDEQQIRRNNDDCLMFGSCCSMIKQSQKQVYLSPSQLISMTYFVGEKKQEPKSLKFLNKSHVASHQGHQKSFFKENSNQIQ